jgi:hypothetical protein
LRRHAHSSTQIAPPMAPPYQTRPEPENRLPRTSSFALDQFSATHHSRAPTIPPISAANTISYAQSTGLPSSFRRLLTIQPEATNARPIISPNVCSVMPKMCSSGCIPL